MCVMSAAGRGDRSHGRRVALARPASPAGRGTDHGTTRPVWRRQPAGEAVKFVEYPEWGTLTGIATAGAEVEALTYTGDMHPPSFTVTSGPCTAAVVGGRSCVGRWPGGYLPSEHCTIAVAGGVGALGACPVFDTYTNLPDGDYLTMPDNSTYTSHDCPAGVVLMGGQTLTWQSDGSYQGTIPQGNGLPRSQYGSGGGWQISFG